jgi:uncharacterized transporter YbjL
MVPVLDLPGVRRLWDLAALFTVLVLVGAILTTPGPTPEMRFGALVGIIAGALILARFGSQPPRR